MKLTPIQIIGIIIVINGALIGSTAQLTDLLGALIAKDIVSIASIGNSVFGGIIMLLSGQGSMVKSVLAMPGVERIAVNGQASSALATLAVDPGQDKIAPTPAAMDKVTATAKAAASVLFAIIIAGLMFAQPAHAAQRAKAVPAAAATPATPATPANPLQSFFDQLNTKAAAINNFTLADAQAAMAMSANDPTGLACYTAIANKIQSTTPGSILPKSLGLLQLIETARLAKLQVAGVQSGSDPVVSGCAALILDANTTLMMLLGQGAVGAAGLSVGLPIALP